MNLEDVMVRDVIAVASEEMIVNVARTMRQTSVGCVVITVDRTVKGIITDRDLLSCITEGHNPSLCKVSNHMNRPVIVLPPDEDLRIAADVMRRKHIKRVPIVETGKLVGLISYSDIARIAREQAKILLLELRWTADLIEDGTLRQHPLTHDDTAAA